MLRGQLALFCLPSLGQANTHLSSAPVIINPPCLKPPGLAQPGTQRSPNTFHRLVYIPLLTTIHEAQPPGEGTRSLKRL